MSDDPSDEFSAEANDEAADALSQRLWAVLHGHGDANQGWALAESLARWLAGHIVPGDRPATTAYRARLLEHHLAIAKELVPVCEADIRQDHPDQDWPPLEEETPCPTPTHPPSGQRH